MPAEVRKSIVASEGRMKDRIGALEARREASDARMESRLEGRSQLSKAKSRLWKAPAETEFSASWIKWGSSRGLAERWLLCCPPASFFFFFLRLLALTMTITSTTHYNVAGFGFIMFILSHRQLFISFAGL